MKISVITIAYNSANSIHDAINSVLSQSYPDIEYIIVDGLSKDKTVDIIKSYGDKITKFVSEPDKGIYDALNKGIGMATGDVIGFMHSDDLFANNQILEKVAHVFQTHHTDSIYGDLEYVYKEDTSKVLRYWKSGNFSIRNLKCGWMPPHPTFYVKRSVYEKYGVFNINYRIAADYDTMLRFLGKYRISTMYLPEVMVKMRVGGASNRSLKNIIRKSKEDYQAIKDNHFGSIFTLVFKNLRKITQFIYK
ncbi:MAG: glycosyltransferase [Lentimicrobiaceae bacterium]|nr:glycosyltransferase [Lentimicrobiaceae bacterium]MCO5265943.1 glycosyltransferase [Lentimicrobium sp.]